MKKTFFPFLFLFLLFTNFSFANILMNDLSLHVSSNNTSTKDIFNSKFEKIDVKQLNYGFNSDISIWLKFELHNISNTKKTATLEVNNPLLEEVILFHPNGTIDKSGMLNINQDRKTINPFFSIDLKSESQDIYYLKVVNKTTALQFSINLVDEKTFLQKDLNKQFLIILFIGIISAFFFYAFVLYLYTRDISYAFYCLYIIVLVFQQLTYVGFLPLHMPSNFTYIDNLIVVPKVGGVIITGIIFARSFLKTKEYEKLDRVYRYIIYAVVLQILFLSTPWFYYPEVTVLTGLIFIIFNLYAAIYVYRKGNKQARFFIVGWSFLIVGFFLSIIDALGIYSMMYHFPSLVLIFTSIEALFLLLAFVDKLNILQTQKDIADKKLLDELQQRNVIIEEQVVQRTEMLKNLYRELHHRVKNNLQIMLSIIRLQSDRFNEDVLKEQFIKLENRIKSIAKTHEILYLNDDIEYISMYDYIYSLCEDIEVSFEKEDIYFSVNTEVRMPLKEAVYIGIIVNELVYNSMKYAEGCSEIKIDLSKSKNDFSLFVGDNGNGFNYEEVSKDSLGLKLVKNLVTDQLDGVINMDTNNKTEYNIRFKI